jgi:hypothetical protein
MNDHIDDVELARECFDKAKDRLDQRLYGESATRLTEGYIKLGNAYVGLAWLESHRNGSRG